ncbi:hybrid sensor histidine kinase/response regulator [Vibrio hepatarius]|uniref:hybrid sensor histidine kinase/response regulator n=1 Tax=Vibrio hepatarius TaxID=171383 RepID=UPI001C08BEB8|nr:ATP-binding protein [Vibrio hepatarius]MBU2898097.1 response regulator [Vibrio hepatarius]
MPQDLNKMNALKINIIILICVFGGGVLLLTPFLFNNLHERSTIEKHLAAIKQTTQDIIYFDEVLTMSARMYAFTQHPHWEERYFETADRLDNALQKAKSLEPKVKEVIDATAHTNEQLIAIEMRAIELVKKQRYSDAQSLLLNNKYSIIKAEYEKYVLQALRKSIHHNEVVLLQEITATKNWLLSSVFLLFVLFLSLLIYFYRYNKRTESIISSNVKELESKVQDLEALTSELEDANHAKSDLLAKISHELKTPINGIHGSLQLIDSKEVGKDTQVLVRNAILCSDMLVKLVDDILDFAKLNSNKYTLNIEEYNITELLTSVEKIYTTVCENKGVDFHLSNNIDSPIRLCDGLRFKQVIFNVLNNATKFTANGSVTLTVQELGVAGDLRVDITDTGIGMSPTSQAKLFNEFEQGDSSISRTYGGTGLGMSIVKSLMDVMDGKIEVLSELGTGTTVILHLNFPFIDDGVVKVDITKDPEYYSALKGLGVLVAEDNRVNKIVITKFLNNIGISPIIASDGQEALDMVSDEIHLILMDIQMPIMDGVTACQKIKQLRPDLPIIAVTANVQESEIKDYLSKGFGDVLPKPIKMEDLYCSIHKAAIASSDLVKIKDHHTLFSNN